MLSVKALSIALLGLCSLAAAAPASPLLAGRSSDYTKRIVVSPPVTYPNATTLWKTGQRNVTATWDVPSYATGYKGTLLLGYLDRNDSTGNEHLFSKPLADNFNLTDGQVTFDLPCDGKIKSLATYIVVLLGDSGNKSQNFTIHRDLDNCPNLRPKKVKSKAVTLSSTYTMSTAAQTSPSAATAAADDGDDGDN